MFYLEVNALNSLTDLEYVYLTASTEAVFNEAYNCEKCQLKLRTPEQRRMKGCEGSASFRYTVENIRFATCPGNYTSTQVSYLFTVFSLYEDNGLLPEGKSIFDVTYKFMQIFGIIRSIKGKHEEKLRERQNGKSNHGRNRR